ncbi:MAG: AAA family ATPase [Actinomycetota bacterium]
MYNNLQIVTGAPGVGKTTVLEQLDGGLHIFEEPARPIIYEHRALNGSTASDLPVDDFVARLLERSIGDWEHASASGTSAIFDRGVPDCIAYALHSGADPKPSIEASRQYRYHADVLLLEPWEDIYTNDDLRNMTFAQVLAFHERVLEAYEIAGYGIVKVPQDSVAERAAFIEAFVLDS